MTEPLVLKFEWDTIAMNGYGWYNYDHDIGFCLGGFAEIFEVDAGRDLEIAFVACPCRKCSKKNGLDLDRQDFTMFDYAYEETLVFGEAFWESAVSGMYLFHDEHGLYEKVVFEGVEKLAKLAPARRYSFFSIWHP